jgi:hypothetical protein
VQPLDSRWLIRGRRCQDYERAEGNYILGIEATLDKYEDTIDDVFFSILDVEEDSTKARI